MKENQEFPGSSVQDRMLPLPGGQSLIPGKETKIPQAMQCSQDK